MNGCASGLLKASLTPSARIFSASAWPAARTTVSSSFAPSEFPAARRAIPMPTCASVSLASISSAARNSFSAAPGRRCSNRRQPSVRCSCASGAATGGAEACSSAARWHFLYFFPEPQGQASLRPVAASRAGASFGSSVLLEASALIADLVPVLVAALVPVLVAALLVCLAVILGLPSLLGTGPYPKNIGRDHAPARRTN